MEISRRAQFDDPQWRAWLADFPTIDPEGGHIPAVKFAKRVKAHLRQADRLPSPSDADHASLKSELSSYFDSIGTTIGKRIGLGVLAGCSGLAGFVADFFIPGASVGMKFLSGMLSLGGGATVFSASLEVRNISVAKMAVNNWIRRL